VLLRAVRALACVLLPPLCPACRARGPGGGPATFCGPCAARLEPLQEPFCPRCGLSFPGAGPSHPCPRCSAERPPFEELRTWGLYRGGLLDAIQRWKFGRDLSWRTALEGLACEAQGRFWPALRVAAVVPVPCHPATLRRRGFDPAALLSRAVARRADAVWRPQALRKVRAIPELVGLDAQERRAAVRGAYAPAERLGGTVLLVDDVVTSTATARACAEACRRAGAARTLVLGLARTPLGPVGA